MTDIEERPTGVGEPLEVIALVAPGAGPMQRPTRSRRLVVVALIGAVSLLLAGFLLVRRDDDHGPSGLAVQTTGDAADDLTGAAPPPTAPVTDPPTRLAPPTTTIPLTLSVTGEPVRGSTITLTFHGLESVRGQDVYLSITTPGPVHTSSGGDRVGSMGFATSVVDDQGAIAFEVGVPNWLSGQDDVIPVVVGDPYLLVVTTQSHGVSGTVPFSVVEAAPDRPYPAGAVRGAAECGAPPLEIDFNGRIWLPAAPDPFPASVRSVAGTFTIRADGTGAFVAADGTASTFTPTGHGYSC